jgi:hypothetical protein
MGASVSISVVCSGCDEETELVLASLDEVEREVCECGYSFVVLSVAAFEPVHAKRGQLIELPRRGDGLSRAA